VTPNGDLEKGALIVKSRIKIEEGERKEKDDQDQIHPTDPKRRKK